MSNINFNSFVLKKIAFEKASSGNNAPTAYTRYESVSNFNSASLEELMNLDIAALLKADNSLDVLGEDATGDQKALAEMVKTFLELDGINQVADVNGDGELSQEEALNFMQQTMAFDGNLSDLTMDDLDAVVQAMNINLEEVFQNTIDEYVAEEMAADEVGKAKEAQQAQQASNVGNTGATNSSGSSYSPSSVKNSSSAGQTETPKTAEEIEQKIAEKEDEISNVEAEAEEQIQEQEDAKAEAMKSNGMSEEEIKAYQEQEKKIEEDIQATEKEIDENNNVISENEATISSNKNYIGSIESQISSNQSAMSSIADDDENASSKKSEFQSKIDSLQQEKETIEAENKKLEEENAQKKNEIATAETKKQELEAQKQELLNKTLNESEGFAKGIASSQAVSEIKAQISKYDENIAQIRADKDEKVASLRSEIQELNVQLKDVQQTEERAAFLKDNVCSNGLGLTGEELVDYAKQMLERYGESRGYCATGVSRTFQMAYGISMGGNGCDWDSNMDKLVADGAFKEVTGDYATSADLASLPAGAVVCWEATGGTSGGAAYGHVCIADGNGGEISDHYSANIYKSIGGRSDQYRVYIPV